MTNLLFKNYNCIDETGLRNFPDSIELCSFKRNGLYPILVLDSSVCLDIVTFVDNKSKLKEDARYMVESFLVYQNMMGIDVIGGLGIFELALGGRKLTLDNKKFSDYGSKLLLALKLSNESLFQDIYVTKDLKEIDIIDKHQEFLPILNASYVSLLKLRLLAQKGTSRKNSLSLLQEYTEWLKDELDCIMGLELELAKNIFGGNSDLQPLLGRDNNVLNELWGTAWDFLHYRFACLYFHFSTIDGIPQKSFFITKDNRLTRLLKHLQLEAVIKEEHGLKGIFISSTKEYNHFKGHRSKLKVLERELFIERAKQNKGKVLDLIKLAEMKNKLENSLIQLYRA
ncbi:MAG TPA: hypothetical protein VIH57_11810 [Bacteroidales bacterium]